ncbi:hypothetical protein DXA62_11620 [Coprobacillus sp. OF03-2AA]|jgi:hypothetical protein|nr:hypothetical protein DXA62_11620 [Coprobacillus sp. OF03-2AA]
MNYYTLKNTNYENQILEFVNEIENNKIKHGHYYLFHTQYDVWDNERITVNCFSLCRFRFNFLKFVNSKNELYAADVINHPSKYLYDVTDAVNKYGLSEFNDKIQKLRKEFLS